MLRNLKNCTKPQKIFSVYSRLTNTIPLPSLWIISHSRCSESSQGAIVGQSGLRTVIANDLPDVSQVVRSDLRVIFGQVLAEAGLSQTRAAKVCFTDQPTLSKILSGRSDSVSTDQLLRWLVQLGCTVEISVQSPTAPKAGAIKAVFHE